MDKVYIVKEQYTFESTTESRVTIFSTIEKARRKFNEVVEQERKNSWIAELSDVVEDECDFEGGDYYAYLDGRASEYSTDIVIQEKEVF